MSNAKLALRATPSDIYPLVPLIAGVTLSNEESYQFTEDALWLIAQRVSHSEDPAAHLLGLVKALRRTIDAGFTSGITASALACHHILESALSDHLEEAGWAQGGVASGAVPPVPMSPSDP